MTLEQQLRAIHDAMDTGGEGCSDFYSTAHDGDCGTMQTLREAARIGAEIEREECAAIVCRHPYEYRLSPSDACGCCYSANAIRARGVPNDPR